MKFPSSFIALAALYLLPGILAAAPPATQSAPKPAVSSATGAKKGGASGAPAPGAGTTSGGPSVDFSLVNTNGDKIKVYVLGQDGAGKLAAVTKSGFQYPGDGKLDDRMSLTLEKGNNDIKIPGYMISARVFAAKDGDLQFSVSSGGLVEPSAVDDNDPSAKIDWGFVELTHTTSGFWANIAHVDFVGLPMGISLTSGGSTQTAKGVKNGAVKEICNNLKGKGQQWSALCKGKASDGSPLRVLSPEHASITGFYEPYVDKVWSAYESKTLTVDTQGSGGKVKCQVKSGQLDCAGSSRKYSKPSTSDIWGCDSGPFEVGGGDNDLHKAIVPRLCAAFHRSTFLIDGGDTQPGVHSDMYYGEGPTNWYAKYVHEAEMDHKGYTFPYDDVHVEPDETAGVVEGTQPTKFTVTIGGGAGGDGNSTSSAEPKQSGSGAGPSKTRAPQSGASTQAGKPKRELLFSA